METALIIIHLIFALALIVIVLLQHGKQEGLSGAIAGGAETFFGKNKGRTVDAMLKKVTSVVAILFIITSLALAYVGSRTDDAAAAGAAQTEENVNLTQEQLEELISQQAENVEVTGEEADGAEAAEPETEDGEGENAAEAGEGENTADAE